MNEDLIERFKRGNGGRGHTTRAEVLILPQKLNNKVRQYYEPVGKPLAAGPWLNRPEIPTSAEILDIENVNSSSSDIVEIVPNRAIGGWESKNAYLSAHYELFREDTVRPLREAICQVRQTPGENEDAFKGTVGIYQDVFVRGVMCSTRGIALRVTFSTFRAQKKILWEQSKRLISGSLVVLTPAADMFKSKAIVATVAARQLVTLNQDPPEIDIFIARADDLEIDPAMKFIMVEERSAYFEASRHTLLALQKMASEPFPLSEHLVDVRADVSAPAYVEANPSTNMSSVFSGNNGKTYESVNPLAAWPTRAESDVDQFQNAALHSILTKKLSIIQGPPGTGKTFVSVQALKVMLANMKQGDPPIIVTSQTNHALDQLLRHIAKFEENFIRMGGRSKDKDVIKRRTLYEVRKSVSSNTLPGSVGSRSKKKMKQLENDIAAILLPLKTSEKAPLCHRLLEKLGLLTSKQADSLEKGASQWVQATLSNTNKAAQSPIFVWLGRSLEPVKRPGESQDFGFAVEEADLEYEQLMEIEAENMTKEDEEFDGLNGNVYTVSDHFTGRKLPGFGLQKVETCLKEQDMWKMPENSRGAVYRHLQEQAKLCLRDSVREKVKAYDVQARLRSIGNWERDEIILRDQKIIAMTTTGFSKYRGLISALQPRVILIEEAAETLEAPVIATCLPSIQQLVLVGDHQQLRPHCNVSAHEGKPYYLNISLFERMILNKVEYKILQKQRRMIPEIRRLLYPIYRDKISDHASVLNSADRPDVPGMGGVNSFFFSHQWPESRDDQMSVVNKDEVDMIVGFVEYLSYNGLEADDITILTFYNGQRKRLLNSLRRSVALENRWFNVVTVDSYQGEENKVVILSLARSNERDQIGFLGVDNRVCVALSRAQCGFYMFGNGMLMYRNSNTWSKVLQIIAGRKNKAERPEIQPNRLAEKLPVRCQNHHKLTEISDASEWENIYGGCTQMCKGRLSCGHNCPLTCHPFGHDTVRCHHQCGITLGCGHTCTALCGEKCACEVCCSRPRALHKKTVSQVTGVSSDSSSSWNSFALVEPARCAAIASAPVRDAPSASAPVATNVSIRLVELDDDEHDVSRGVECLTLDKKGQAKGNKKQKTNDESGSISLLD